MLWRRFAGTPSMAGHENVPSVHLQPGAANDGDPSRHAVCPLRRDGGLVGAHPDARPPRCPPRTGSPQRRRQLRRRNGPADAVRTTFSEGFRARASARRSRQINDEGKPKWQANLHFAVCETYRQAIAERRAEREAFDMADAMVCERHPGVRPVEARRRVARNAVL